ncbi:MAG: hypothetical protein ACTSRT_21630 [Promethearchaeota archaeon]
MARCGFCKEKLSIDDFITDKLISTYNRKTSHTKRRVIMFECPHCEAI